MRAICASDLGNPQITDSPLTAPGWPGIAPRRTSAKKSAVGTALSDGSRVWFTASHGILNEIYYPEVDNACMRDVGLLVTSSDGFFAEEKRDCQQGQGFYMSMFSGFIDISTWLPAFY